MGLVTDLGAGATVGLDTALFIYFIEEHPRYLPIVEPLFAAIDTGHLTAVTSAITLLEVLVIPYRAHDAGLASRYEALLAGSRGLSLIDLSRSQLHAAARLRGTNPALRMPDALQLAAASSTGCSAFVTNDRKLPSVAGLAVLQLDAYLADD